MNYLINFLQILLVIISLTIVLSKSNIKIVIYISAFSLLSASLYFFNQAPDVALAEVAIGSAIMPLLYILSISKQREFIVVSHLGDDDYLNCHEESLGKGFKLLQQFTNFYKLKLFIYSNTDVNELKGVFRKSNIDLIIEKDPSSNTYLLIGKKSSVLMNKLEEMVRSDQYTKVVKIKESDTSD